MVHKLDPDVELSNEYKLLILCARTRMTEEIEDEIKSLIQQDIDWDYLLQISAKHRLTPLLYWQLYFVCPDSVPSEMMKRLTIHFNENAQRNLLFMGELFKILELLKSNGITAIPYKGPVLSILNYGNLSLREFGDLDIFIQEENILKMKKILISNGYKIYFDPRGILEKIYFKSQRDYQFYNPDNNVKIEIHWNSIGLSFSSRSDIFKNPKIEFVYINNKKIMTISPEDMFLILCIHASGHQWERLSWICDIAEFIRSNKDINWENLFKKGKFTGFSRILQINILLAVNLFDLEVGNHVLEQIKKDDSVKSLYFEIKRNLFYQQKNQNALNKALFRLRIRERTSEKIKDFFKVIISQYIFLIYLILKPIK